MLPRVYRRWLGDWLGREIPEETLATCDNCAMAAPPGTPQTSAMAEHFGPSKCCTYFPSLPNFQVGGILRDDAVRDGAARVTALIRNRVGIDPLGVRADRRRAELYRIGARAGFGRAETFRCPYFVQDSSASCSVWPYREAVCSTYFCKHDRPAQGRAFWDELRGLITQVEVAVAAHCAVELGIAATIVDRLLGDNGGLSSAADVDGRADDELHATLWGSWLGREDAFYVECARRSDDLDLAAIRKLGGIVLERRLAATRRTFDALHATALPARLRIAPTLRLGAAQRPGKIRLLAGPTQPVEMTTVVLELLTYFQGQPLDEVKAALVEQGIAVDSGLLEMLWSYGFLVEVPGGA